MHHYFYHSSVYSLHISQHPLLPQTSHHTSKNPPALENIRPKTLLSLEEPALGERESKKKLSASFSWWVACLPQPYICREGEDGSSCKWLPDRCCHKGVTCNRDQRQMTKEDCYWYLWSCDVFSIECYTPKHPTTSCLFRFYLHSCSTTLFYNFVIWIYTEGREHEWYHLLTNCQRGMQH